MEHRLHEALRYMGVRGTAEDEILIPLQDTFNMLEQGDMQPRYLLRTGALCGNHNMPVIEAVPGALPLHLPGQMAKQMLSGCHSASILVCTMGAAFERIQRLRRNDVLMSLMLDACGSVLVEEGCDRAVEALAKKNPRDFLTDRFSPGYGDLPLTVQPALLDAVDAFRRLGVQATESCMLLPQKTVTAIIGLSDQPQPARIRGCGYCSLKGRCSYAHSGGCSL